MAEKSAKSQVESVAAEEENTLATSLATHERNLPSYLSDYTDVPGQNKLLTIKNRRRSMRANLTKKINIIDEYLKSRKSRKLIELAVTQLNRAWEQLIENHKEFQTMCSCDKELQDEDTWLIESQAVVEEVICRTFEYQELKIDSDGSESNVPIAPRGMKQIDIAERMKDFEENTSVAGKADNIMMDLKTLRPQIKDEDSPGKETKFRVNKVKEWLTKTKPEKEPDALKDEENLPKDTEGKDAIVDLTKSGLVRSAVVSSLPKINLPVFHGDPCEWPNWYGMFKALVHDQRLTKTQKMIYLKASVRGSAEKAIAGMFFTGTMYEEAIKELTHRFGNPELISRSLINKLLELPALKDDSTLSLRTFVDNLHNIVRTLKSYGPKATSRNC